MQIINSQQNYQLYPNYENQTRIPICKYDVQVIVYDSKIQLDSQKFKSKLVIDRKQNQILKQNIEIKEIFKVSAFLGILTIENLKFLVFADEIILICKIFSHEIYQIYSVRILPLQNDELTKECEQKLTQIKKIISSQHYFSYTYTLTLSQQKINFGQFYDEQFLWNHSMLLNTIKEIKTIGKEWLVQVIQGYVGYFEVIQKDLKYYQISRRSQLRGGTRYNHRGGDNKGNVANFVETETIIVFNENIISHCQIRGSIPLYWEQVGFNAQLQIVQNENVQHEIFQKHMLSLKIQYEKVLSLNLLSQNSQREIELTEKYLNKIQQNEYDFIEYKQIDFHEVCKGDKFENLNKHIQTIIPYIENYGFFLIKNKQIIQNQQGVIRTNCLDCLDRTNVVMSKIAAIALKYMLKSVGYNDIKINEQEDILNYFDKTLSSNKIFGRIKYLWADQGDDISQLYAGTNSSTAQITKTGKSGMFGQLYEQTIKGVERFYQHNFEDDFKNECLQILSSRKNQIQEDLLEQIYSGKEFISEQNQQDQIQQDLIIQKQNDLDDEYEIITSENTKIMLN